MAQSFVELVALAGVSENQEATEGSCDRNGARSEWGNGRGQGEKTGGGKNESQAQGKLFFFFPTSDEA